MAAKTEKYLYKKWEEEFNEQVKNGERERLAEEKFNRPIKTFLEQEFGQNIGEKILDVGSGLYSETYLPEGHEIYRIDWLPQIDKKENSYVCNVESMPFEENMFGIVLSKQVYGSLLNPEKCLDEMARVLKPNGLLIIIDWKGNLKGDDFRVEDFEPERVANKIETMSLKIIKIEQLMERRVVIKNVMKNAYLTAIVARKNSEMPSRIDLLEF